MTITSGFSCNLCVYVIQVLWEHVQPSQNFSIYNGGVEAASNLLSKQKTERSETVGKKGDWEIKTYHLIIK